ncbi:MAG: hypothetical protein AB2A00_10440 [Myxococcota bacterium]
MAARRKKVTPKRKKQAAARTTPVVRTAPLAGGREPRMMVATPPGRPPQGALDERAVEDAIRAWMARPNKSARDYFQGDFKGLLRDAEDMAKGREDLPLFRERCTPITERDFDWLDLLLLEMQKLGDDEMSLNADGQVLERELKVVMRNVVDARSAILGRAAACGINNGMFRMVINYQRPATMLAGARTVIRNARDNLGLFNDAEFAGRLVDKLEHWTAELERLVDIGRGLSADGMTQRTRAAAVKRLLYDCISYLAPWGREAVGPSPRVPGRYRLEKLFIARRRAATAAAKAKAPAKGAAATAKGPAATAKTPVLVGG